MLFRTILKHATDAVEKDEISSDNHPIGGYKTGNPRPMSFS